MGVVHVVLPMSDQQVRTLVSTVERGVLPFQEYFVKYHCEPTMTGVQFQGIESAFLSEQASTALKECDIVIICPSNPWVSISPIIEIKDVKSILSTKTVVAVSPIIGGKTVKGPAAKMYAEMGIVPSAAAVAEQYERLIQGFVLDIVDEDQMQQIRQCGIIPFAVNTLMSDNSTREKLARETLDFAERIKKV
jgi:LPPG:FO 2-phospho-L-lactate transferase